MATLSRFDTELKALERVVKEKKAVIQQAELTLTELQHNIEVSKTELTKAKNFVENHEKMYEWIEHEKECVDFSIALIEKAGIVIQPILVCVANLVNPTRNTTSRPSMWRVFDKRSWSFKALKRV